MNPRKKEDFKKIRDAVAESFRKMSDFRENRHALVKLEVGSEYAAGGEAKSVYLNMLSLAKNIYVRQCAVREPTARITSPFRELRPDAAELKLACKEVAIETRFGVTLRRAVDEALHSPLAAVKVGMEYVGDAEKYGEKIPITQPFVKLVSFDDYVRDMSARSAYEPAFEGDRYYLTKEEILNRYPKSEKWVSKLTEADLSMQDNEGQERTEEISHSPVTGGDNWQNKVAVWDIWLAKERLMVTYLATRDEEPLNITELDSPEESPYHCLWFTNVPDNAMPLPPFSVLRNMQELANSLFRRLSAQAKNQKRVAAFADEDSANEFKKAHDLDGIKYDGQEPRNIEVGGVDQRTLALLTQVRDMFSWAAGNLDSLGGLSPMAETARQDEMLMRSASAQIADMQDATAEFARKIFRQLAWYEWTDPARERILEKPIPGTDLVVPVRWSKETREADFLDFNFNINPMSMREDNPALKVQKIQAVISNIFTPLFPFMQQQGLGLDVRRLTGLVADYNNIPELEQIIVSVDPNAAMEGQRPSGNPIPKPAKTERQYTRVNRSAGTRRGSDAALTQLLMGGDVQDAQKAAIGGPNV